jgi:fatty acid-binding protein DegV
VQPFERERTHKRAVARLKEIAIADCPAGGEGWLAVMHAGAANEAQDLAADLGTQLFQDDVPIYDLPPAIVVHGGPGILGISFIVTK